MSASERAGDTGERETRIEHGGGEDARTPERSVLADPVSDVTESVPVRAAQNEATRGETPPRPGQGKSHGEPPSS